MSITPRGMSIQEAYRLYRDGKLLVNRRYQRKLVWTVPEKERLIDSILKGYPIPLILLAERPKVYGAGNYEIIDGMQRLNAIFAFVENAFPLEGEYFDIREFARAKQLAEENIFQPVQDEASYLPPKRCADLLDYQLAVTIYPTTSEDNTTDVFGRINSSGKQLSPQERRQAGVVTPFAEMVRKIAAELRGDASKEVLLLTEMPEISIESKRSIQGYGLRAEDTLWCKQGILLISQLRDSEDEEMIADIASSILFNQPNAKSREFLDDLYSPDSNEYKKIERELVLYGGPDKISYEIKTTFSVLRETIEAYSSEINCLRRIVSPGSSNPIKTAFFAIFMAFYDLVVHQERSPSDPTQIMHSLRNLSRDITSSAHYTKTEDRERNIDKTVGLIQKYFVKKEPSVLRHGPGLALDFENSVRRSKIETARYEMKQGILRLSSRRELDNDLFPRIIATICGIANVGPDADGYLFIGVADRPEHAQKIQQMDRITPIELAGRYVVGVEREVNVLSSALEKYVGILLDQVRQSLLSEPLKTQILTKCDTVEYRGFSIVRFVIPAQKDVS